MHLFGIISGIIFLDQWSKWSIESSYNLYQSEPIIQNFLHFTYVTNDGMAFGLSFPGGKQLLLAMTIILTCVIIFMLWKEREGNLLIQYALSFILAGAVGNLIDRLFFGKVVDFLDVMIGDFHWYIFNVADSSVSIGMGLFVIHSIFFDKKEINVSK